MVLPGAEVGPVDFDVGEAAMSNTCLDPKPCSERRLAANRANAAKSTGPKTVAGKERSRGNAVTHGLTAQILDASGIDPVTERARLAAWMGELNLTGSAIDAFLVGQAVRISLRLERCETVQKTLAAEVHRAIEAGDDVDDVSEDRRGPAAQMQSLMRYEIQSERTLLRLIKELRRGTAVESTAPPRPKPVPPPLIPAQNEPKPVTRIAYLNVAATPIPHPEIPVAPTVPPDPARKQLERHLNTMFKALGKRPSDRRKRG